MQHLTYDEIRAGMNRLDAAQQLRLLEELAATVRRRMNEESGQETILDLRGLGAGIWKDVEVQEYVDSERSTWAG